MAESPESPEEEEKEREHNPSQLVQSIGQLSLQEEGGGGRSQEEAVKMMIACSRYNLLKPEERQRGEGKEAFENYLSIALAGLGRG